MKKTLSLTLGAAVSAALLWLAFRKADVAAVCALMGGLQAKYLLPVGVTVLGELAIRGLKWALLLGRMDPACVWTATRLTASGLALNNILPFRFGEIARISLSAAHFHINIVSLVAAVCAEKILDAAALAALCLCAVCATGALPAGFAARFTPENIRITVLIAAAIVTALIFGRRFSVLRHFRASFISGLQAFRSPATGAALFAMAVFQWFFNALNYYWLSPAFGAASAVDIPRSILLSATGAAASSVPGVPGYFGSFELAVSSVLRNWRIAADPALSYAAAAHLLPYLMITIAGLLLLWRTDYPLKQLWHSVLREERV
ncbi:MAG TPA: lysylphosphatidylglycerol synthase transmembrane domain-containing protein [Elusimicrobiales bacterium]|nr:lysylphosphatidylglycerol synthase transmembrane domain-containing protein [Elusimicrobiales bacterium]